MNYNHWKATMKPIINIFIRGLIAIIPFTLTLYVLFWFAGAVEMALGNIFKFFFPDNWYIKGLGFLLGLPVIFFFGVFLESRTFRSQFENFEEFILQIPVIKSVYTTIRDFSSLFSSENKGKFDQVVLIKVPTGDGQQIGFITVSETDEASYTFITDDQIAVYVPFSYQMGGNTVIMSRENVTEIDMSVEDALRFVATAGVVGNVNEDKKR